MRIERNLGMDLVRATEMAALRAGRTMGRGDKNAADQAAVDAMRYALDNVPMDGVVVIGEGEKDEAPMLFTGERVGSGEEPAVDIAVDPVEGTTLLAEGMPGAIAVVAIAERGSLYSWSGLAYMDKLAVGEAARGAIDINAPVDENIRNVAKALKKQVEDVTVVVLDRPRHQDLIRQIRATGARIKLILHGDVSAGVMTAIEDPPADMLMGIGGAPEAVITACALKCVGGEIQCKLWPRNDEERSPRAGQPARSVEGLPHHRPGEGRERVLRRHGHHARRVSARRLILRRRRGHALGGDALGLRHRALHRVAPPLGQADADLGAALRPEIKGKR